MQDNSRYARDVFYIGVEEKEQIDSLNIRVKKLEKVNDSLINIIKNDTNNRYISKK